MIVLFSKSIGKLLIESAIDRSIGISIEIGQPYIHKNEHLYLYIQILCLNFRLGIFK